VARDGTCTPAHEARAGDPVRTAAASLFRAAGVRKYQKVKGLHGNKWEFVDILGKAWERLSFPDCSLIQRQQIQHTRTDWLPTRRALDGGCRVGVHFLRSTKCLAATPLGDELIVALASLKLWRFRRYLRWRSSIPGRIESLR
jgi:hypothetical protein